MTTVENAESAEGVYRGQVSRFLEGRRHDLPDVLRHLESSQATLSHIAAMMLHALKGGHKILVAGNGGSAAEAQHFSAELVGRFKQDRVPYPAISLSTDTSILTALANDYSYDDVFARQVTALAQDGDLLLAYSTSGESENLVRAAQAADQKGARVIALTGDKPNRLADLANLAVRVPSSETAIVQEVHLMITHLVCGIIEDEMTR